MGKMSQTINSRLMKADVECETEVKKKKRGTINRMTKEMKKIFINEQREDTKEKERKKTQNGTKRTKTD